MSKLKENFTLEYNNAPWRKPTMLIKNYIFIEFFEQRKRQHCNEKIMMRQKVLVRKRQTKIKIKDNWLKMLKKTICWLNNTSNDVANGAGKRKGIEN